MFLIRSGYDYAQRFQIQYQGQPDTITGWTFKASLVAADGTELIADTACTVVSVPLATIEVNFSAAQTASLLPQSDAIIEIAILAGGKRLPLPSIAVTVEAGRVLS